MVAAVTPRVRRFGQRPAGHLHRADGGFVKVDDG
jgi:hypothetical protein